MPSGSRGDVLIILVVNEPAAAPAWARRANRETLAALRAQFGPSRGAAEAIERFDHPRGALLLIDRTRPGRTLPSDRGVGLARKIAADVALRLWASGAIRSPWIHCTDADALLPDDYFTRPPVRSACARTSVEPVALLYDFVHVSSRGAEHADAALRYEIFLRYYVLGLQAAGSPYAYQSLGSTLAVSPEAYAAVRGFPRRSAGEDFHVLAKLAKLGPLRALRGSPLRLSGRLSERVPFGTGAGVARELRRMQEGRCYPAPDPRAFAWLGAWLRTLSEIGAGRGDVPDPIEAVFARNSAADPDVDAAPLWNILAESGAVAAAEAGRGRGARHLHERFDALKTLRFLHAVRDRYLPSIPLRQAIARAPFTPVPATDDLEALRRALESLEAAGTGSPWAGQTVCSR